MPYIIAETADQTRDYARRLLDAADDPNEVQTDTSQGGRIAFRVSDELARKAGFSVTEDDEPEQTPIVVGGGGPGGADSGAENEGEPPAPEAPARNASRDAWVEFLDAQKPPVTYEAGATRNELVEAWDAHQAAAQTPGEQQ